MGLGNPGPRYERTRHNVGFMVLDALTAGLELVWARREHGRRIYDETTWTVDGRSIVLIKPQNYMNRSGDALEERVHAEPPLRAREVVVVYDDADLALGRIRVRPSGGSGGHNGLRSLRDTLGDAGFARVRVGVRGEGREERELADYVLAPFEEDERPARDWAVATAAAAVRAVIEEGVVPAMNRFNGSTMERETAGEGPAERHDSPA